MTTVADEFTHLTAALSVDVVTHELSWVFTRGLAWYGFPELAARVPPSPPGDPAAIAVFLTAAVITLGHEVLELDGFVDVDEIPVYSAYLADDPVTVWVTGPDDLESALPRDLLGEDVLLVSCSLWDRPRRRATGEGR